MEYQFNCILIPVTINDDLIISNRNIESSDFLLFAFLTPINNNENHHNFFKPGDKIISKAVINCKCYLRNTPGSQTVYIIKVNNFDELVKEKQCLVSRDEFQNFEFLYVYDELVTNFRKKYNSRLLITPTTINELMITRLYKCCKHDLIKWILLEYSLLSRLHCKGEKINEMFILSYLDNFTKDNSENLFLHGTMPIYKANCAFSFTKWIIKFYCNFDWYAVTDEICKIINGLKANYEKSLRLYNELNNLTTNSALTTGANAGSKGSVMINILYYDVMNKYIKKVVDYEHIDIDTIRSDFEKKILFYGQEYYNQILKYYQKEMIISKELKVVPFYNTVSENHLYLYSPRRPSEFHNSMTPLQETLSGCLNRKYHNSIGTESKLCMDWMYTNETNYKDHVFVKFDKMIDEKKDTVTISEVKLKMTNHMPLVMLTYNNFRYFTFISNIEKLDQPYLFARARLMQLVSDHKANPTLNSFMNYVKLCFVIINRYQLGLNEQVLNDAPIFGMVLDIDITEKRVADWYYSGDMWSNKITLIGYIKDIFLELMEDILGLKDFGRTTQIIFYESVPSGEASKIGMRMVARSNKYYVKNSAVMTSIIDGLIFINKHGRHAAIINNENDCPLKNCDFIDSCIYNQKRHFLRLVLHAKSNEEGNFERPLIPIISNTNNVMDNMEYFKPSNCLIHHLHKGLGTANEIIRIDHIPNINASRILKHLSFDEIYTNSLNQTATIECMITDYDDDITEVNDRQENDDVEDVEEEIEDEDDNCNDDEDDLKNINMSDKIQTLIHDESFIEDIRLLMKHRPIHQINTLLKSFTSVKKMYSTVYSICSNVKVCLKKNHIVADRNPCSYKAYIFQKRNVLYCSIYGYCFGVDCNSIKIGTYIIA